MSKLRVAAAATAVTLIGAFASMGQANAATTAGVGTTETNSSLVDVALGTGGSLLHLRVLGDVAKTIADPAVGPTSALTQQYALKVESSLLPALNLTLPNPPLESKTPGGSSSVTGQALNLNVLPALISGALNPSTLTSAVDAAGAHSGLDSSLLNLNLVAGLLDVQSVSSNLGGLAGGAEANGSKGLDVGAISVLNLGALLKGLGIDITKLPIGSVSGLLSTLKLNNLIEGLPVGTSLEGLVSSLLGSLTDVSGLTGVLSGVPGASTLLPTLNGLLGGLPLGGGVLSGAAVDPTKTVTELVTSVTSLLTSVLGDALDTLDSVSLLKLNGLKIGTLTKAASTKEASKSDVIGTLGSISVGGVTLPGLDLSSTLSTITGVVNSLQSTLDGVLGSLSPALAGILQVKFFDKKSDNGITSANGYVRSLAGITGLGVAIVPPLDLAGIVGSLGSTAGIGGILSTAGGAGALTSVTGLLGGTALGGTLNSLLGSVNALAGGASIKIADVSTGSNFKVLSASSAAATPVTQLPRTGANTTIFLIIGMLMVGGVIVGRRYIPMMVTTKK